MRDGRAQQARCLEDHIELHWTVGFRIAKEQFSFPLFGLIHIRGGQVEYRALAGRSRSGDEELGDLLAGDDVADDISNHDICVERNDGTMRTTFVTIRLQGTGGASYGSAFVSENQNIIRPARMTHQSVGQISSCNEQQNPNLLMYFRDIQLRAVVI